MLSYFSSSVSKKLSVLFMCLFITIYDLFNPHLCLTKDVGLQDNGCVSEIRCANKLLLPWHAKQNINLIYNFSICCIFTLWSWPCRAPWVLVFLFCRTRVFQRPACVSVSHPPIIRWPVFPSFI